MMPLSHINNNDNIEFGDIKLFNTISERGNNDKDNKKREKILMKIPNKEIPVEYYIKSKEWRDLRDKLTKKLKLFVREQYNVRINKIRLNSKGGRGNNYDFDVIINDNIEFPLEFKYNVKSVNDAPQFLSQGNPSDYITDIKFEEWFFDNYLPKIAELGGLEMPDRDVYLKENKSNDVKCLALYVEKYKNKNNKDFMKKCREISKIAIEKYVGETTLNIEALTQKMANQKDKVYLCYKDGDFYIDKKEYDYKITDVIDKKGPNYICKTTNGHKLEVKLRFKNCCGLQFPALQIRRKIPTVKDLKEICRNNGITPPRLKSDILICLDEKNVIY
jgi:hypothetical protein